MFILLHIIALLTTACFAQTNTRFSGTFNYTSQAMTGGVVPGQIYYDWSQKAYKTIFNLPGHSYSETYLYGSEASDGVNATQWLFATDSSCCQPLSLSSSNMPRLFPDPSYVSVGSDSINNVTCTHYTPATTPTVEYSVTDIWFDSNGNLCQVIFLSSDNGTYTFTSISTTASFDDNSLFEAPQSCFCTAPLDIIFVVDLSGSITINDWSYVLQFFHGFIQNNNFQLEPNQTNIALEIFANFSSVQIPFTTGSNEVNADAALKAMQCCNSGDPSSTSCCSYGYTSISTAIRNAADALYHQHQLRPYATPVMIVMTDGGHNTLFNATNPGGSCGYYTQPCVQYVQPSPDGIGYIPAQDPPALGNAWYYCIGDKNNDSIPDSWYTPTTQLPLDAAGLIQPQLPPSNLMATCYVDLISAREYALDQFDGNLPIFSIGVNGISIALNLISNNLFRKPANAPQQDLSNSWISWTPTYNASEPIPDPSRVILPSSFSNLAAIQNLLTTTVCKQYSNTSCVECCGFCTKCGICVPPPVCTTSRSCFQVVNPTSSSPCCGVEPLCPIVNLPCNISSCDTTTNTCSFFNPCVTTQNCTGGCVPPVGQCLIGDCLNESCHYNQTCPPSNACNQSYCADGQCLSHPVPCNSNDICKIDSCDPLLGCQHTDVICPPPNDTCTESVCDTRYGCISQAIQCQLDTANGTVLRIYHNHTEVQSTFALAAGYCGYAFCTNGTCVVASYPCTATIVGAALSAGIIAGIIIAIIACLLLSGGGVAAYAQYAKNDGLATVHQNPLFHPAGTGGENPLHGGG